MSNHLQAAKELRKYASKSKAKVLQGFFKTGPGEYGEGDVFVGVTVPNTRKVAKKFKNLAPKDLKQLLSSKVHEDRLMALLIVVAKFKEVSTISEKEKWVDFYLKQRNRINNWDLVDVTAYKILGDYCYELGSNAILEKLSKSKRHWDKRMAIVSTYRFIKEGELDLTFRFAEEFLNESEDLMHKATGWMLREAGKKDEARLKAFIEKYGTKMPRTMLRYSIEKFPESTRKAILAATR